MPDQPRPSGRQLLARADFMARAVFARLVADDELAELSGSRRVSLLGPAISGLVGLLAVLWGSVQSGSPFSLQQPGAWFFGTAGAGKPTSSLGVLVTWAGLIVVVRAWLDLVHRVRVSPGIAVARVGVVAALWCVPLLVGPVLFSRDVYSYAAQGQLYLAGMSPYRFGVAFLGPASFARFVDSVWQTTPAPYGPAFLWLAARVAWASASHVAWSVVGFRLLALAGVGVAASACTALARSHGADRALVIALSVANPLVLFGLVSAAHNDALMIAFICLAATLAYSGRYFLAVVAAAVGAVIKAPAALAVVFVAWSWTGRGEGIRHRIRPLVTAAMILVGILGLVGRITHLGWGWLPALGYPGHTRNILTPTDLAAQVLAWLSSHVGLTTSFAGWLTFTRVLGGVLAALACGWLLWNSERLGLAYSLGLALLAVVLLGPVIQPWYFTWAFLLLAPSGGALARRLLGLFTVAGVFFWLWQDTWASLSPWGQVGLVVVSILGGLFLTRPGSFRRLRSIVQSASREDVLIRQP